MRRKFIYDKNEDKVVETPRKGWRCYEVIGLDPSFVLGPEKAVVLIGRSKGKKNA